jgi:2-haloacid dehalogenase
LGRRPTAHGPGSNRDVTPARQWDIVAKDFQDLATQLGC